MAPLCGSTLLGGATGPPRAMKKLATQAEKATPQISATVAQIIDRRDRSGIAIRAMGEVMDKVEANAIGALTSRFVC